MSNELKYLEIAITEVCNLNCKACSHFSPLANAGDRVTPEKFRADIRRMKELFPVIFTIRLLGGEPLMHDDWAEMAHYVRRLYPKSHVTIVTNGLLIPQISVEKLDLIAQDNIEFDISLYKPTAAFRDTIEGVCAAHGIKRRYTDPIETFRVRFDPAGNHDVAISYRDCVIGKACTYLYNGMLSGCPAPNTIHLYNRSFGTSISGKEDLIDIHNTTMSAQEILKKLRTELTVCRYCARVEERPWSIAGGTPSKEDWIISGR